MLANMHMGYNYRIYSNLLCVVYVNNNKLFFHSKLQVILFFYKIKYIVFATHLYTSFISE
jgi:hypothetical protein